MASAVAPAYNGSNQATVNHLPVIDCAFSNMFIETEQSVDETKKWQTLRLSQAMFPIFYMFFDF